MTIFWVIATTPVYHVFYVSCLFVVSVISHLGSEDIEDICNI